jgi:hypothetical protein
VSTSAAYQGSMMRPDESARLQAQMSLNKTELAAAKWVFGLLDFDNDGEMLQSSDSGFYAVRMGERSLAHSTCSCSVVFSSSSALPFMPNTRHVLHD